jgi:hypothetical protein
MAVAADRVGKIRASPAGVAETHVSVTFFVGDRAYKLKKPVTTGFLDFSTRAARQAVCHREVELNRRLAPDVYLGVVDVIGLDGRPCDHLVVMRRMPAERRLATLVATGADVDAELRAIAELVARFHAEAPTSPEIADAASPQAVTANWETNFEEMAPFVGAVLDAERTGAVEEMARRYLAGRQPLFSRRIAEGRVREGHGDLLADDIFCLGDGPRILDCIEFDDRLRYGDVLADVAFLAMDLDRLGRPELASRFLTLYRDSSGERHPASLTYHYVAYRAHVRAKVACLRHEQGDPEAAGRARDLLDLAAGHLRRGRVRLVLIGGLPGTGKSTLAAALGLASGWRVWRSDIVRKELAGLPADVSATAAYGRGLYGPESRAGVYRELLARADDALSLGESVILDASWTEPEQRAEAAHVAEQTSSDLLELQCRAPLEVTTTRLRARRAGSDASDADPAVAVAMAEAAAPWPDAIKIDTSGDPEDALAAAVAAVGDWSRLP